MAGIAIVAAASAAVIPIVTSQPVTSRPSRTVDAIATEEPKPANAPPTLSPDGEHSAALALPESMQNCTILSRITPDWSTADQNLAENLQTARDFLAEEKLESLPVEQASAVPSSPEARSPAAIENQAFTEVETALGEAGLLLPGIRVEVTLTCPNPGAP